MAGRVGPGGGGVVRMQDVHWVLTLRAAWTDKAKDMMRCAAFKAGMIDRWGGRLMWHVVMTSRWGGNVGWP